MNASVDTVNAAATAIVTAEARSQPNPVRQKRRWGSCWSMYWCFGHQKTKRIGHAVLAPPPAATTTAAPAAVNPVPATVIVLPFIAPPSSPASFLPSDPPSATQSPAGPLSLTSLSSNAYSHRGPASIFAVGPYAYDTQLVSPPVFSTFTTEPSTAPLTPPPESLQLTTPSSPEVPFAQLLTSSLERTQRGGGVNQKFSLSHYEFQAHQLYPGSPGSQLISPGSVVSNSGTSSPFPGKQPILERRIGEAPNVLGFEHFSTWKWGSRLGSGSVTPDGTGLRSRLGSGSVTPDGMGIGSRLSSGCLTPDGLGPPTHDAFVPPENQKAATALVPTLHNGPKHDETLMDHRVSFELTGEDVARCLANKSANSLSRFPQDNLPESSIEQMRVDEESKKCIELSTENNVDGGEGEKEAWYQRQRSVTLGSTNEFKFDNRSGGKVGLSSEDMKAGNSWSFFPMLQPEVS